MLFKKEEAMICFITRIKVLRYSTLLWVIFSYFHMKKQAKEVPGLYEMFIFIRPQKTIYFVSLWRDISAIAAFNTIVQGHALAVFKVKSAGAEIWSGYFDLRGTSFHSKSWTQNNSCPS
ncbi:MAG TPA: hypothetical protein VFA41_05080 [Ktedonobacteraceae bacterium]|jgi:hypothetical protein|nr:hypothetical protein [Ktedonobacteraceae bacterium]